MKLLRCGAPGKERPAILDRRGEPRDISSIVADISASSLANGVLEALAGIDPDVLPRFEETVRVGMPVADVGKCICVGLNYHDHARETGQPAPQEPILFMKATTALQGPDDDIVCPVKSNKVDWEVELAIVVARRARNVPETEAKAYIAGYCVANDVSERAFQLECGGQWVKGKSCDTFGPIGPWLVTPDEVEDVENLSLRLWVNGDLRQQGTTREMIFKPTYLISYISRFMTLAPGDVILTGTPAGVGMGRTPPAFLSPGDVVELDISGLGRQRQRVVGLT